MSSGDNGFARHGQLEKSVVPRLNQYLLERALGDIALLCVHLSLSGEDFG